MTESLNTINYLISNNQVANAVFTKMVFVILQKKSITFEKLHKKSVG